MVQISRYPLLSHLRSEPSQHVLHFRRGKLVGKGRGLTFWFRPLNSAIAALPAEDLEVPFLIHGRSKDFQEVNVLGAITYRVTNFELLAQRVDFSIQLATGLYQQKPLERIASAITELAQQLSIDLLAEAPLVALLAVGCEQIRQRIDIGMSSNTGLSEIGIAVVAVRVSSVSPSTEVEKALRIPMRETIQQDADEATFKRRAHAVEKERSIQENELQTKIELARRESLLIEQRGTNERRRIADEVESAQIAAQGQANRDELDANARALGIRAVEGAKVGAERERMLIYKEFPPEQLMALAVQELAGKLKTIREVTVTPDHLGAIIKQLGLVVPSPGAIQKAG